MGPLVASAHRDKVRGFLNDVDVAWQGEVPNGPGFWFPATVVTDVPHDAPRRRDEVFGPTIASAG